MYRDKLNLTMYMNIKISPLWDWRHISKDKKVCSYKRSLNSLSIPEHYQESRKHRNLRASLGMFLTPSPTIKKKEALSDN